MLGIVHPTIPDSATFAVSAAVIIGGALGVITSRNAVHAALSLVMTLFGVAVLFIEQQADFLAVVQIIVYAGAIVVLFLFVIMFLGVDRRENIAQEPLRGQRPIALVLILVALGGVIALGRRGALGDGGPCGRGPFAHRRAPECLRAWQVGVHHLPVRVRGHGRAARDRGRRGGCARPPATKGARNRGRRGRRGR